MASNDAVKGNLKDGNRELLMSKHTIANKVNNYAGEFSVKAGKDVTVGDTVVIAVEGESANFTAKVVNLIDNVSGLTAYVKLNISVKLEES